MSNEDSEDEGVSLGAYYDDELVPLGMDVGVGGDVFEQMGWPSQIVGAILVAWYWCWGDSAYLE